jgi:putative heme-binding domain-containing protein
MLHGRAPSPEQAAAFKALARFVREGVDRHAAIQALQRIPARHWPQDEAPALVERVVAYVAELPPQDRTTPAALDALQLGDSLAALLPTEEARRVRQELGELGVRVIRMGAVPHQMIFDKERIAVQAGKPVEIVFENTDLMPHNIVFIQPGSLEEIGHLAETTATHADAVERQYVPASNKVLLASGLLQPRQSERLSFTAPTRPGVYPYVCTYPGHWRRMYGALYVVEDLDEYLADPEAYLAARPLPIEDELLKFNRPRKEWTFEHLAPALAELEHGRSFGNGRQMFQVANCSACHQMDGVGREFGPDLTKLDDDETPEHILRDILDPSAEIDDKYRSWIFETESGRVLTGMIVEETAESVKIIENPLASAEPVELKVSEILDREKSPHSIMPKGLLDKLTRDEILDLIAYIAARGDRNHKLFQGGHDHGQGRKDEGDRKNGHGHGSGH